MQYKQRLAPVVKRRFVRAEKRDGAVFSLGYRPTCERQTPSPLFARTAQDALYDDRNKNGRGECKGQAQSRMRDEARQAT